jgi:hypothetical protein
LHGVDTTSESLYHSRIFLSTSGINYVPTIGKQWEDVKILQDSIFSNQTITITKASLKFLKAEKSTIAALLQCAVGWSGSDLDTLLREVKHLRTSTKF